MPTLRKQESSPFKFNLLSASTEQITIQAVSLVAAAVAIQGETQGETSHLQHYNEVLLQSAFPLCIDVNQLSTYISLVSNNNVDVIAEFLKIVGTLIYGVM